MADEQNSLRDDIMAAQEAVESDDEAKEEPVEVEEAATPETETEETKAEEEVPAKDPEKPADDPEPLAAEPKPEPVSQNAPIDWPDEVKAQWDKLDPNVQEAIANRERHVNEVLQHSADARHAVEQFQQMISPYIPLLQAEGVSDPLAAVNGLLQTTAQLSMGTPAQKAQKIAGLIAHYGVDIQTLDNILAGDPAQDPQSAQFEQMLNQRLAPVDQLLQRVQQAEQQGQQQTEAEAQQTVEQFAADPKNRHFNAVRNVMADLCDVAAQHGQQLPIEQAYERACMMVPEVAEQVMAERTAQAARTQQAELAKKANAASSVRGTRASGDAGAIDADGMSLRETLEAAANLHGNDRI